jgi:integrase
MDGVRDRVEYGAVATHQARARESASAAPQPLRLLDRVRAMVRARHYSRRTERNVAASTQNQALSALLFLYRDVLGQDMPWLDDVVRARRSVRLPVVLTRDEVRAVIRQLRGTPRLMAILLYGSGLRLLECARLRVKDIDFARHQITVRAGKGDKDRVTPLPAIVHAELAQHLEAVRELHDADLRQAAGWVELPGAPRPQVPECRPRMGLAVGVPGHPAVRPPRDGSAAPPPPARIGGATSRQGRGPPCRHREARHLPHAPPLLCHSPARGQPRHSDGPGASRPSRRQHDDDLHPRLQPRPAGVQSPADRMDL